MLYPIAPASSAKQLLDVLKLFLLPVGGGIPAGVLLAQGAGIAWPLTALLYLVSDIILAVVFEPFLRTLAWACSKVLLLARIADAIKRASARSSKPFVGTGAGPLALIIVAFGVDPMTGRAAALAAGYGFLAGWAFAIAGDMLYFAVIAVTTLKLNSYVKNTNLTVSFVLALMILAPAVARRLRTAGRKGTLAGAGEGSG